MGGKLKLFLSQLTMENCHIEDPGEWTPAQARYWLSKYWLGNLSQGKWRVTTSVKLLWASAALVTVVEFWISASRHSIHHLALCLFKILIPNQAGLAPHQLYYAIVPGDAVITQFWLIPWYAHIHSTHILWFGWTKCCSKADWEKCEMISVLTLMKFSLLSWCSQPREIGHPKWQISYEPMSPQSLSHLDFPVFRSTASGDERIKSIRFTAATLKIDILVTFWTGCLGMTNLLCFKIHMDGSWISSVCISLSTTIGFWIYMHEVIRYNI